jgi:hypothetical protein
MLIPALFTSTSTALNRSSAAAIADFRLLPDADVGGMGDRGAAGLDAPGDGLGEALGPSGDSDDLGAAPGEIDRDSLADSRRRARDHRDPAP